MRKSFIVLATTHSGTVNRKRAVMATLFMHSMRRSREQTWCSGEGNDKDKADIKLTPPQDQPTQGGGDIRRLTARHTDASGCHD
ncbi:hypothetical protein DPMN_106793 [Dreissena polymorpha]|uniref:Uncharacterized protein n=1 Tax=Dreissena polymorpha TaxID=45954 RepID=A0A9D4K5K8_DREPO|nr:hypothetical protein DPMN_106793 [Dreissena polymorpha]